MGLLEKSFWLVTSISIWMSQGILIQLHSWSYWIIMFGLQNHVDFPTLSSGHSLELILTGRDTRIVSGVRNHSHLPSDHIAVGCQLDIGRPGVIRKHISCRNLKSIDMDTFLRDLSSAVNVDVPDDIFSLTSLYDT